MAKRHIGSIMAALVFRLSIWYYWAIYTLRRIVTLTPIITTKARVTNTPYIYNLALFFILYMLTDI